jgi:hypothetical protein
MDNRPVEAARSYVDAIQLGNEISRGGFIINRLVGIACEAIGESPLSKIAPKLNPEEARSVMVELEKIDSDRVTWDEIRRNENRFVRHELSKSFSPIIWVTSAWQDRRTRKRAEMRHKRVVAHLRLLTAELGVRCYRSGEGRVPTSLEQLVPKYLRRVPSDPFSAQPLVYRSQGTNWLLYSVGEDGLDDGGKRVVRSVPGTVAKGDLFYDSPY